MKVSNCCNQPGIIEVSEDNFFDAEAAGVCVKCNEPCEYVEQIDCSKITDVEFDFHYRNTGTGQVADGYVSSAKYDGQEMSDEMLEQLNSDARYSSFISMELHKQHYL